MKHFLLKIEPVVWLLFGQGLLIGTMLLTGWILIVGLAIPLGIVSVEVLPFARAHPRASNNIGRLVRAAVIVLPIWKGAHHMRHLSIDFHGADRDSWVAPILYTIATIGSLAGLLAVVRL
jgi:fumarate reductase subunit D